MRGCRRGNYSHAIRLEAAGTPNGIAGDHPCRVSNAAQAASTSDQMRSHFSGEDGASNW